MFNAIKIRSYLTKLILFGWDTYDHIILDAVIR
jgi:hypothetical protein